MNFADRYPWRVFFVLLGGSLVGAVAIIPYALALSGERLKEVPLPLPILLILQFVQSAALLGVAVGVGLLVSGKIGLGAPILEAWLYERRNLLTARMFAASATAGATIGMVIAGLVYLVFLPLIPRLPLAAEGAVPIWKRLLSCLYGAVDEEISTRLFLLSLVLWLIGRVWHTSQGKPARGAFWTANTLVAILFGLGHLPAAAHMMQINATAILYVLSLNGVAALLFGYLFWRHGLESAMIAHFFTDLALVLAPVILR
jgi:hypothetical protein